MEIISKTQLFTMVVFLQIGTTILFGFSTSSGRDAWISVVISTLLGIILIFMNTRLMRMLPGLSLVEWYPAVFGKWLGVPISWLYAILFLYDASRATADLEDLLPSTILPRTPPLFFLTVFICFVAYAIYCGMEAFGRVSQIVFPIIIVMYVLVVILLVFSNVVHFQKLLPIMEEGFRKPWKSVWPTGITQSFGETIVFATFWPMVKQKDKIVKTMILATLFSGMIILTIDILSITVLGENLFMNSIYPMYTVIRLISLADFIEHLDSLAAIFFINIAFIKITIYMLAATYCMQQLLCLKNRRVLVLPVTFIVLFMGVTMSDNIQEHIFGVHMKILSPYFWTPLFILIPAALFIVALIRRQLNYL